MNLHQYQLPIFKQEVICKQWYNCISGISLPVVIIDLRRLFSKNSLTINAISNMN